MSWKYFKLKRFLENPKYVELNINVHKIWALSYPILLMLIVTQGTNVADMAFLSFHSIDDFNACAMTHTTVWIFTGILYWIGFSLRPMIALNYAKGNMNKINLLVWQILYFSGLIIIFYAGIALIGEKLFLHNTILGDLQGKYFFIMIIFAPLVLIISVLSSFFSGQGLTKYVFKVSAIGVILNIILDYFLIFGVEGFFEGLGIKGAAIARVGSYMVQGVILFYTFYKSYDSLSFNVHRRFCKRTLSKCLKFSAPQVLTHLAMFSGFSIYYFLILKMETQSVIISSICLNVFLVFSFFPKALGEGLLILVGHSIGLKQSYQIWQLLKASIKMLLIFTLLFYGLFMLFEDIILYHYLKEGIFQPHTYQMAHETLLIFLITCFLEGLRTLLFHFLIGIKNNNFFRWFNPVSVYLFLIIPVLLGVCFFDLNIRGATTITTFQILCSTLYYVHRINLFRKSLKISLYSWGFLNCPFNVF